MKAVLWILVGIVLLVLTFVLAPMFHWFWFEIVYYNLTFWITVVILGVVFLFISRSYSEGNDDFLLPAWLSGIFLVLVVIFLPIYQTLNTNWQLVKNVPVINLQQLPETKEARFLPMAVAEKFGANKVQDSKHHLGDMDPLDTGTEISWIAPRVPTGFWNAVGGNTDGLVNVKPDGSVQTIHQSLKYGEGMYFSHSIYWQLYRKHYWTFLPEVYYLLEKDEVLSIVPYIGYRYSFPSLVPYWQGVYVVHANGNIEDLPPQVAMEDPRFANQRLYPEELAKRVGNAWAFRGGIWNVLFVHKDQTEVPRISGEVNQMPYLVPTKDGPTWFIGLEPYGPAYSIYKMLFIDAHNGTINLYELPADSALTGPVKAGGYVRSAFPMYNWYTKGDKESAGNIISIEPRPIIKDGVLYWQYSITTIDYSGINKTALCDARTNSVVYFENLDELSGFLQGKFAGRLAGASTTTQSAAPQTTTVSTVYTTTVDIDVTKLPDADLIKLIQKAAQELAKRQK